MTWTSNGSSERRLSLPPNWESLRTQTLDRCGKRCEVIKSNGKRCWDKSTDVDHITPGDDHSLPNLRGICRWHHAQKSSREGVEARAQKNAVLFRAEEIHPGILAVPIPPPKHRGF